MTKSTFLSLALLFCIPLFSFAGPSCGKPEYNEERFQAIQTMHIDGYRFDITKPPVYAKNSKVYQNVKNGEGCTGDSVILVTDPNENVVFFKRIYLANYFAKLDNYKVEQRGRVDVAIMQHSGGISCCEYLHLFQTTPTFKYLGQEEAYLK